MDISNKTASVLIVIALIISVIGLFNLGDGGLNLITGLGSKEGAAQSPVIEGATYLITVLIMIIITLALFIILIKKKDEYNK